MFARLLQTLRRRRFAPPLSATSPDPLPLPPSGWAAPRTGGVQWPLPASAA
jgi:hypothetical protein